MKLKFYGTRGSIPICDAGFQQFGGNTTCLQITFTDTNRIAIIDAGTGLRNLGRDLRAIGHKQEQIVIAFTHFHWDHIQGFPFSFDQAMQLAEMAGVKRLALTHHDPDHDDEFLERIEKLCQERFPNVVLAREGMEISIGEAI